MVDNQLDLFKNADEYFDSSVSYLHIVKDEQVVQMKVEELFDVDVYDELYAISFVASPRFFFDTVNEFEKVQLILGIEDGEHAASFDQGIKKLFNMNDRFSFLESLSSDTKNKLFNDQFEVRYPKKGIPVHSKVYLLKGNDKTRLIIVDLRQYLGHK